MSYEQRSSKGHDFRGSGEGSRLCISNEELTRQGWKVERSGKGFKWQNPNGRVFYSSKAVSEFLNKPEVDAVPRSSDSESDSDYLPSSSDCVSSPEKGTRHTLPPALAPSGCKRIRTDVIPRQPIQLPESYHIAMTSQLEDFIDKINGCRQCTVQEGCEGELIAVRVDDLGLGGAVKVWFACSGCGQEVNYASSQVALQSHRRNCVSLATALCFLVWGQGYPHYYKVLKLGLGIKVLAKSNFYRVIEISYPHVKTVLDGMCERAKTRMKKKSPDILGSWQRAVTTSDGCWLIRGFHSQCCSFVIVDFLSGGILYYGHLCMRGSNGICDADLWEGTAKSAEGQLAMLLFTQAKKEGMLCEVNWQDQDSSSGNSFRSVFPDGSLSRVMLCGGHVGRSHGNSLKEYKGKKVLDKMFKDKHRKSYGEIGSVKCVCEGRSHLKKCGCISDDFIAGAKRNHFSALKRMRILGRYHCRDIHKWVNDNGEEEECDFHPQLLCSCGKCGDREVKTNDGNGDDGHDSEEDESEDSDEEDEPELQCKGKPYSSRHHLKCKLHALLYQIECDRVSPKAHDVIHDEMGRGHSNLPESKFHVLSRFRPKNVNLHQLHYEFATNCGLCQSNMTFMCKQEGPQYHWMRELLTLSGLPIPDGIEAIGLDENERRMKVLQSRTTVEAKSARAKRKQKRLQESARRKNFVRRQRLIHTYGAEEELDEIDDDEVLAEVQRRLRGKGKRQPANPR